MTERRAPIIDVTDGAATVTLAGEFEMTATFTVEPALERVRDTPGLRLVTLDLSGVTFIDSVGMGVVNQLARELEERGVAMRIVPGPEAVQRVFEITGTAETLPFDHGFPSSGVGH